MPDTFPFGQAFAWHPDPAQAAETNLARFWQRHGLDSYAALRRWALEDVERFWTAALEDLGTVWRTPPERVLDASGGFMHPRWCVGGRMNVTESLLDRWLPAHGARDAVRYESEDGRTERLTYAELHAAVETCAAGLRAAGLGKGDAVGFFMPMAPPLVVAFLAAARIGAVALPLFSGYGAEAVASRLQDAGARALFVSDALSRRGRRVPLRPVAAEALATCPAVETVVVHGTREHEGDLAWETLLARGREALAADPAAGRPEDTAAEDPLLLIYTSGTTGRPKGALHTHCGFPVKAAQDMRHAMDVREGDVVWWMSDMGWMMGPWLVYGALFCGATMMLYDGAPDAPGPDAPDGAGRTWALCARHGVTLLGLSPALVRALRPHGPEPVRAHDLSALRACGSTGSPWDPESWHWLFTHVLGGRKPILNYSGGTEISGGIVCGTFLEPLKPCGFPGPVVGMDADVVDDDGCPVRGAVGELVLRQPWIGQTRGFWNDPDGARYRDAYWRRHEGLWTHGDFAAIDDDGQWFILGRSDDTIKVAGKRLGPAEVEAVLNAHPDVAESAAVGVPDDVKGEAVVAFATLAPAHPAWTDAEAREALRADLLARLEAALGKALRPRALLFTRAQPKTRNAKIMRRVVRAAHLGTDPGNTTALEDPAAVQAVAEAL